MRWRSCAARRAIVAPARKQKERSKRGAGDKGFIGHRAAKQMKRATEIERRVERRIEERSTLLRDWEKERALALQSPAKPLAVPLKVANLVLRLDGRVLIDRLSFELARGARIALIGPNGCGKTKLLDAIAGERLPAAVRARGRGGSDAARAGDPGPPGAAMAHRLPARPAARRTASTRPGSARCSALSTSSATCSSTRSRR